LKVPDNLEKNLVSKEGFIMIILIISLKRKYCFKDREIKDSKLFTRRSDEK